MTHEEKYDQARARFQTAQEKVRATPPPVSQKFPPGSRVRISPESDWYPGELATVEYTYGHAYGGDNVRDYSLFVDRRGSSSWFDEDLLTLAN